MKNTRRVDPKILIAWGLIFGSGLTSWGLVILAVHIFA